MRITIKLFSMLRSYHQEYENGMALLDLPNGLSVADVLTRLGLPEKIPKIVLINGEQKNLTDQLADGDTLSVFPPMAGG